VDKVNSTKELADAAGVSIGRGNTITNLQHLVQENGIARTYFVDTTPRHVPKQSGHPSAVKAAPEGTAGACYLLQS
jgi:hypothetical protein